jgi:hypothetical protein
VDYDLPDFPQSLHTVGTHARRSLAFVRLFEEVLLIGESVADGNSSWKGHCLPPERASFDQGTVWLPRRSLPSRNFIRIIQPLNLLTSSSIRRFPEFLISAIN